MRWEREPVSVRDALALLFASGNILDIGAIFCTYQNSAKARPIGLALAIERAFSLQDRRGFGSSEMLGCRGSITGLLPLPMNLTE
jgi:hypothetical protein